MICADDGTEVTVTAKFWYVNGFEGGQEAAEAVTKAFVDKTNEVMKNSKVSIKYQQWGTVQQVFSVTHKIQILGRLEGVISLMPRSTQNRSQNCQLSNWVC